MALAKRIIPCLDVDNGRVVKGVKFLDLKDAGDPVEVARRYDREEADELVFLDITASHEERGTILICHGNVENISTHVKLDLWLIDAGYNLFIFDYRGYGRSEGTPTVQGINRDAEAALETLLADDTFAVIEVNLDHPGSSPPLAQYLPVLRRIQEAGRPLLLWGEVNPSDWDLLRRELSPAGLSIQPIMRVPGDIFRHRW